MTKNYVPLSGVSDLVNEVSQLSLPSLPKSKVNPASWAYDRIVQEIASFEADLDENEEIGLRLTAAPDVGAMHIVDVGFAGPEMLMYYGVNEHRKPMQLLQHYTQMSILLTAVPAIETPARRIGFRLTEDETD